MVERRKTFQASSQEERPSMRRFLRWEGTKARIVVSWGSAVRVKVFWEEAKEGCGYMVSERSSLKSMYSRLDIFERSFSGSSGSVRCVHRLGWQQFVEWDPGKPVKDWALTGVEKGRHLG